MPVVVLGIEQDVVAAVDHDILAVGIVVADIVVAAVADNGTVVAVVADVDSLAADNEEVAGSRLVVGFGPGAQLGMDHAHLDSSHLAYLHAAATENQRRGNSLEVFFTLMVLVDDAVHSREDLCFSRQLRDHVH